MAVPIYNRESFLEAVLYKTTYTNTKVVHDVLHSA